MIHVKRKVARPVPPVRVEAMWGRWGSAGSEESTVRLMLEIGAAEVLGIVEMTEMVILAHREERATLLSLEAPQHCGTSRIRGAMATEIGGIDDLKNSRS